MIERGLGHRIQEQFQRPVDFAPGSAGITVQCHARASKELYGNGDGLVPLRWLVHVVDPVAGFAFGSGSSYRSAHRPTIDRLVVLFTRRKKDARLLLLNDVRKRDA